MKWFDWLEHHAYRSGERLAICDLETEQKLTYRQLNDRSARLATYLHTLGVERDKRVALLLPNCVEFFEIQFACAKLGAICVPINWRLAVRELQHILDDCAPSVLIYHQMFEEQIVTVKKHGLEVLELKDFGLSSDYTYAVDTSVEIQLQNHPKMEDTWLLLYTSGTTGLPKGVKITYLMVLMNILNMGLVAGVSGRSVQLVLLPFFHVGGINLYANPILHAGGTVIVLRQFDPSTVLTALSNESLGINIFFGVPTQLQMISQLPEFNSVDLSSIDYACVGGSACSEALLRQWLDKGVPLSQGWGMTETGPGSLVLDASDALRKIGSCGKPVLYNEVQIVDDKLKKVGVDEVGQLIVRGPNVTPGYWGSSEANETDFSDGWLKTGDAAKVDCEGYFYIVDRIKDMFISGGENVYPAEIENVLYEVPGILEVAVIGIPDEKWGEVGMAVVVCNPQLVLEEGAILDHCSKHLAKYKVPKRVVFTAEIPKTASGKIQKTLLLDLFE